MKQLITTKTNIVEKILRDENGKLVKARFYIYQNGGRIKARLLDFSYINESNKIEDQILKIFGCVKSNECVSRILNKKESVSPYFYNNLIYLSGSKPRAPTF